MKLVTRDTDYAIRALCFIAKRKRRVSASELVKELSMPRPFLRKILQTLGREGLVRSYKGIGGGFALAKEPQAIFLTDVIEIFQGPLRINECVFKKRICPNRSLCALKKRLDIIEGYVTNELKEITIRTLLK